jgi:hypothetical protein
MRKAGKTPQATTRAVGVINRILAGEFEMLPATGEAAEL